MKTLTMKLPDSLAAWLDHESKRMKQSKSGFVREVLQSRQQEQRSQARSALALAGDLCGCVASGRRDLSRNKQYLKGFGR